MWKASGGKPEHGDVAAARESVAAARSGEAFGRVWRRRAVRGEAFLGAAAKARGTLHDAHGHVLDVEAAARVLGAVLQVARNFWLAAARGLRWSSLSTQRCKVRAMDFRNSAKVREMDFRNSEI